MNRRITNPPNMVLISGIPECFAYGAYETTNKLAAPPNITSYQSYSGEGISGCVFGRGNYCEKDKDYVGDDVPTRP